MADRTAIFNRLAHVAFEPPPGDALRAESLGEHPSSIVDVVGRR